MPELAQGATNKVGAETGFQADDAGRQGLERFIQRRPLDLTAKSDFAAVGAKAETSLPISIPIDAQGGVMPMDASPG
jgi:hypothetical protein